MLPGEEELEKKKKKVARPRWTHVKTITEDVLAKVIEDENARRDSQMEDERNSIKDKIFARSTLYQMFKDVEGVTLTIDYEVASYRSADVSVELKIDNSSIDGEIEEYLKLPSELKKKLTKMDGLKVGDKELKAAAQTIAAYVLVELEKNSGADMLAVIGELVSDWVKKQ